MSWAREYLKCISDHEGGAIKTEMEAFCPLGSIKVSQFVLDTHTLKRHGRRTPK